MRIYIFSRRTLSRGGADNTRDLFIKLRCHRYVVASGCARARARTFVMSTIILLVHDVIVLRKHRRKETGRPGEKYARARESRSRFVVIERRKGVRRYGRNSEDVARRESVHVRIDRTRATGAIADRQRQFAGIWRIKRARSRDRKHRVSTRRSVDFVYTS